MEVVMLAIIIGGLMFIGMLAIGNAIIGKRSNLGELVRQPGDADKKSMSWRDMLKKSERVIKPLGELIPRSPEEMSKQERRLVQAGFRRKDSAVMFYGVKLGVAITFLTIFVVLGYLPSNPLLYIVLSVLLGAMLPDLFLARAIRSRKERIQLAIPDALDLTVVCVEAGLGLDQSLMRIGEEIHSIHQDLSDELKLLNLEIQAGKSRAQSLRNLSNRTEVDDLKALVAVLIQTDRFGTSVAQSLRVFSDSLRTKRRQRAEERAAKTTIKMIPPLVFFILPSIFVVVLGPAVITLLKQFLPSLGN
jgi:tight adherence protein C